MIQLPPTNPTIDIYLQMHQFNFNLYYPNLAFSKWKLCRYSFPAPLAALKWWTMYGVFNKIIYDYKEVHYTNGRHRTCKKKQIKLSMRTKKMQIKTDDHWWHDTETVMTTTKIKHKHLKTDVRNIYLIGITNLIFLDMKPFHLGFCFLIDYIWVFDGKSANYDWGLAVDFALTPTSNSIRWTFTFSHQIAYCVF